MKGWFDAFRSDGGPTLYSYSNRTPVTGDVTTLALYIIFFTIFLAFLVIFPGVRKERFTTFTSVTLSLFVGTAILVSKHGSGWHVAQTDITSSYRAFSREKIAAELGAYIGLGHVNITLRAIEANRSEDIDFNERFSWHASGEMTANYREALVRGLPFPILTVAEYFSLRQEGFAWGGQYRAAGYYGSILLWASFATWVLMNLLLIVVPRYGAYCLMLTGALLLATNLVYIMLIPPEPLVVRFELGKALSFRLGWCYWLVLSAGALCVIVGLLIALIDLIYPHRFSTILEVDYDTPYDRHIIIEESHVTRTNKKKSGSRLEEPPTAGIGSRLLRRLSKRERYEDRQGVVNEGFEMDPPNSPWRYPFSRTTAGGDRIPPAAAMAARSNNRGFGFQRSESQDSQSSTCTGSSGASSLGLSFLHREHIPSVHSDPAGSTARSVSPLPKHLHHLIHQGHQDNITTTSL